MLFQVTLLSKTLTSNSMSEKYFTVHPYFFLFFMHDTQETP